MVTYPSEEILIARGQYSTLSNERKQHIERCQKITDTIRQHLLKALLGVQERPPKDRASLDAMRACLGNYENSWNRVEELCKEMEPLKDLAWGEDDHD